ncbi:MAG: alpha-ketoglutarate-dependent dioxygenase AlkB, partial [Acidimicrobiales bacterium]
MSSPAWQGSLLATGEPEPDAGFTSLLRLDLDGGAWVDHAPGWLTGADALFDELLWSTPWQSHEMAMYGQRVTQPRLSARWGCTPHDPMLPAVINRVAELLSSRYDARFDSVGANLYRDGRDSVAWHGDRVLRTVPVATVAIVSLGATRRFLLRPKQGGLSIRFDLGPGDLLVMGGTAQRTWQHTVPKTALTVGPRVSVTFRHAVDPAARPPALAAHPVSRA